jgi:hypothetical protein
MSKKTPLTREFTSEIEWVEGIFERSNSEHSIVSAKSAPKSFDIFAKSKLGIENPDILDVEAKKLKFCSGVYGDICCFIQIIPFSRTARKGSIFQQFIIHIKKLVKDYSKYINSSY